jgi:hypothetical protein
MLSCVDAIVEPPYIAVRHHVVDETDVYVLPPAVSIAEAHIDLLGCDLRVTDATSVRPDLLPECLRTSTEQYSKRDEAQHPRRS